MLKSFKNWWRVWGQVFGFLLLIVSLNAFWMIFTSEMKYDWRYSLTWLIMFFGGAAWYSWQMGVHGWRLPKDIKETH
jgi:hypothetical protein